MCAPVERKLNRLWLTPGLTRARACPACSFTTIDPNVGYGFIEKEAPPQIRGADGDPARHEIEVTLKDVAGLVPGAWQGVGKGNRFLNDLVDADALVHIVDASGGADDGGNKGSETEQAGDPVLDVRWIYAELHRWIFGNVWAKSRSRQADPGRFAGLFTGYNAVADDALEAMRRAGINLEEWHLMGVLDRATVHRIVAHFLRLRFPTLLACNKDDDPRSAENIARMREAFPHERCVSVSALRRTGVRAALRAAVDLRRPLYVYNLRPGRTLRPGQRQVASADTVCRLFRPLSTVNDCYEYWHHNVCDESLALPGELMRAEFLAGDGARRVAKKSDALVSETVVVLMTNRKRQSWQQNGGNG